MRTMDKWTSRDYEPMRRKLVEHGVLMCVCRGNGYYLYHGQLYEDGRHEVKALGEPVSASLRLGLGLYIELANRQYEDAISELEDEAREFERWPRSAGVYRLPSGQYVSASESERVASRVTGGLDGLLLVANGQLTRSEVETHADELEAMAAAVCEDADAICYYTEADY